MKCHILVTKTWIDDYNKVRLRTKVEAAKEVVWKPELGLSEARNSEARFKEW